MLATGSRLPAASVLPRLHWIDWLRVAAIAGVFLFHALRPFNADDWHVKNAEQSAELGIAMGVFWRNRVTRVLLGARAQPAGSVATDVGRIAAGEPPAALEARHG